MIQAAHRAGRSLRRDFGEILHISTRSAENFAHAAAREVARTLEDSLKTARPNAQVLTQKTQGSQNGWHLEPLNGFVNFLHGIPYFALGVVLEEDGKPTAGVVYNPVTDETFAAARGGGAFLNTQRLRVADRRHPQGALLGIGDIKDLQQLPPLPCALRLTGAPLLDLAHVAAGHLDAFWGHHLTPLEATAGALLVQTAGGLASDSSSSPASSPSSFPSSFLAANLDLHATLKETLSNA